MIVVMKPEARVEDIDRVLTTVRGWGWEGHLVRGSERTVIAVVPGAGARRAVRPSWDCVRALAGVAKVVPILLTARSVGQAKQG